MSVEDFSYTGKWWVPRDPQRKIEGTLTFSHRSGLSLVVHEPWSNAVDRTGRIFTSEDRAIILGETEDGTPITLEGCERLDNDVDEVQGYNLVDGYVPERGYIGVAFVTEPTFTKVVVEYSHLAVWSMLGVEGKQPSPVLQGDPYDGAHVSVLFDQEGWDVPQEKVNKPKPKVMIEVDQPTTINELKERLITPLRDLITFAIGKASHPDLSTILKTQADQGDQYALAMDQANQIVGLYVQNLDNSEGATHDWIKVVEYGQAPASQNYSLVPPATAFVPSDIEDFDKLLRGWFNDEMRIVYTLFLDTNMTLAASSDWITSRMFLNLTQAAEIYHKAKKYEVELREKPKRSQEERSKGREASELWPQAEHNCLMAQIWKAFEAEGIKKHKKWLDSRKGEWNNPSFRAMIEDLLERANVYPFTQIFPDEATRTSFARLVADTRNKFTHGAPKPGAKVFDGRRLYFALIILHTLIRFYTLQELGWPRTWSVVLANRNVLHFMAVDVLTHFVRSEELRIWYNQVAGAML